MNTMADPVTRFRISPEDRTLLNEVREFAKHHAAIGVASPAMRMLVEPFEMPDGEGFLIRHHPGPLTHALEFLHVTQPHHDSFELIVRAEGKQDGQVAWSFQETDALMAHGPENEITAIDAASIRERLEEGVFNWILKVSAQISGNTPLVPEQAVSHPDTQPH